MKIINTKNRMNSLVPILSAMVKRTEILISCVIVNEDLSVFMKETQDTLKEFLHE